jgi:hypothetical protein
MADGIDAMQKARRMRDRAEEIRVLAERMRFPPARNTMLRLAATFEKLAERLVNARQQRGGDAHRTG